MLVGTAELDSALVQDVTLGSLQQPVLGSFVVVELVLEKLLAVPSWDCGMLDG